MSRSTYCDQFIYLTNAKTHLERMRVIFLFFLHIFSRFLFHFCVLGISFSSSDESENLFVIILLFLLILLDCCFNGDKTILHFFNEHVSCPSDLVLSLHTVFFCSWSSSSDDESTATLRFFFIPFTNSIFYKRISGFTYEVTGVYNLPFSSSASTFYNCI